jgi:hypothetical protein
VWLKIKPPQLRRRKMPSVEHQASSDVDTSEKEGQEWTVSRRRLLKVLAAAGGAAAASTLLPSQWTRPVIEVGVLPAHAQITPGAATPTTRPPAIIIGCYAANASGAATIGATDTIETYAYISLAIAGIELRRTITLNQVGHPQHGVVAIDTGFTDASGRFQAPNFDLSTLFPTISTGPDRIIIMWEFVDPTAGTGTCIRNIEIV